VSARTKTNRTGETNPFGGLKTKTRRKKKPAPPVAMAIRPRRRSGSSWVGEFPARKDTAALADGFRQRVDDFIAALLAAGARVSVSATWRPPERAYLMHYSYCIAKEDLDPTEVPMREGVDIEWVHRKAGKIDLPSSKAGAQQMVVGYGTVFKPSLSSRHTEGRAIDMTIRWSGSLSIMDANGRRVVIDSGPRSGSNPELEAVGATYGIIKLLSDPPHWSSDGH
jgi:hypothetical protein